MPRTTTIVLIAILLGLAVFIFPFGEGRSRADGSDHRAEQARQEGNPGSSSSGVRKSGKSGLSPRPLEEMLPPNAKLIEGNLSTTETEERVVVLLDKVRVQAAGARSFRNGILFKAPYRMEGLDDKAARDWTMDSDEGYV